MPAGWMQPCQRDIRWRLAMAGLVMFTGWAWRSGGLPLSRFLYKYGGDAWWALLVFVCVGMVFRRRPTAVVAAIAAIVAAGVELLQLYHAPWLDAVRATALGRAALGNTFNAPDLLAYAAGIALGTAIEAAGPHTAGQASDQGQRIRQP